jgi:Zn-dependent protease with chaperone function
MIAAAALAAWAVLLLAVGAPLLAGAAWPDRAPRLGMIAWLTLTASALVSVVLSGAALLVPAAQVSAGLARLLAACVVTLQADYAHPGGAVLSWAGAALAVLVTGRLAWSAAAAVLARVRIGRGHSRRLLAVGRADRRLGAIVVDHHAPAAYCLPGPRRPVVLTSAALTALDSHQLAAVLAHEKAHQDGHHHLLVALAAIPAAAFPPVTAFRLARDEVGRLAELAADDHAALASPRLAVAEALLTLASAPAGLASLGASGVGDVAGAVLTLGPSRGAALGAGGATAARIHRMIAAPDPLGRTAVAAWTAAVTVLVALPLLALAAPAIAARAQDGFPPPPPPYPSAVAYSHADHWLRNC